MARVLPGRAASLAVRLCPNDCRSSCQASRPLKGPTSSLIDQEDRSRRRWLVVGILAVWGPGLVVMLADTDAGSLITAAQSGSEWGYRMVLPQLVLIPILYVVQEMTVRLGILTNKGQGALIREHFGRGWALLAAVPLFASAVGALFTEYVGIAGVGELFGVPRTLTVPVAAAFLIGVAMTGSYRRVERIGIAFGLAELVFIPAVVMAHPSLSAIGHGLGHVPLDNSSYVFLLAANVGAVIMPWMVFYQQGAVLDKGLQPRNIPSERRDTAVGAGLTQLIMIVVVLTFAATIGRSHPGATLRTVTDMSSALRPVLGAVGGRSSLEQPSSAPPWSQLSSRHWPVPGRLSEVFGWTHTLNERPDRNTAKFYISYGLAHVLGATIVLLSLNLVRLVIDVEVMNALLLPIVLGFLLVLEARALPTSIGCTGLAE